MHACGIGTSRHSLLVIICGFGIYSIVIIMEETYIRILMLVMGTNNRCEKIILICRLSGE